MSTKAVKKPARARAPRKSTLRFPKLKPAEERLKKLGKVRGLLGSLRWGSAKQQITPKMREQAGEFWNFIGDLEAQQRTVVKGIRKKRAIMMDQGYSEWNVEDDND